MSRRSLQSVVAASPVTMTPGQKKFWHSIIVAFVTGALTAAQVALTSGLTEKKAILVALGAVVTGGLARVAGAVLAWVNTA